MSPCFRVLVNPVVINTCVWFKKKDTFYISWNCCSHWSIIYEYIYIFEAWGLKNISIKLGILVLLCTFWKYSSQEKELKILILSMPFFLKNSYPVYTVVFDWWFLFLNFCCLWPILIPLCFPPSKSEGKCNWQLSDFPWGTFYPWCSTSQTEERHFFT